jgi:hypothetical protein
VAFFEHTVRFGYDPTGTLDGTTVSFENGTLADSDVGDILGLDELVTADGVVGLFKGYLEFFYEGSPYRLLRVEDAGWTWFFGDIPDAIASYFIETFPTLDSINNDFDIIQYADDYILCFAPGTLIATPAGERPVETLAIGDAVLTADGRAVAVRWMGRQTVRTGLAGERARPVRVRAGALAPGVPHSDLVLTADHALILDGLAVNAGALVNGAGIAFVPLADLPPAVTYWHVETAAHDVVLANGAPAETFIDYVGRKAFDNHREYLDLYGCERIIPEMPAPRISSRRQLPAALAARLGIPCFADDVEADFAALMAGDGTARDRAA